MPVCTAEDDKQAIKKMEVFMASGTLDAEVKLKGPPMYVIAFLHFKTALNKKNVQDLVSQRLFEIQRFRSKLISETQGKKVMYFWQKMPLEKIPMDTLVTEIKDVKTEEQLSTFCSNLTPLPEELPLWRAYIMNNMSDGRSLLAWVIDHTIGDGPALIAALLSILDRDQNIQVPQPRTQKPVSCWTGLRSSCLAGYNVFIGENANPGDPPSRLKVKDHRNPDKERALSRSPSLDMARVKEVKDMYPDATINDVLLTTVCLTLQEYFKRYEPSVIEKKQQFRANFPVSIRNKDQRDNMLSVENFGNHFSAGNCTFPIHIEDPIEMFWSIKKQMDAIKISPEPILRDKLVGLLAASNTKKVDVLDMVLDQYGKVSAMLSNTPGPQQTVYFGGQTIDDIGFYILPPVGLYFGIVSYQGKISCAVSVAAECEPNASNLSSLWEMAFEKLQTATVERWKAGGKSAFAKPTETTCCG